VFPPPEIKTARLLLRAPLAADADAIFTRYASDAEVSKYLAWPRHASTEETRGILESISAQWAKGVPACYLAFARDDGRLLGSTGLAFETPERASAGYVLARNAWGQGFATEMARAIVDVAFSYPRLWRLWAICHIDHRASEHVLAKAGFTREATLRRHTVFPNLGTADPQDIAMWARVRA
jgi:RimJ/RimL family protein N-acetyltransferase